MPIYICYIYYIYYIKTIIGNVFSTPHYPPRGELVQAPNITSLTQAANA